jgi:hypothetical protein
MPLESFIERAEHHGHAAMAYLLLKEIAGNSRASRETLRCRWTDAHSASPFNRITGR